ncbi:hypothetical protein N5P37_006150 [Trichoderma harzianum]|uniref:Uncharacterized protein n=1 Tax=Trichoderma harzianum CBS 226.95 TaxID=983964 RepID=A0A2T4AA84_TRIHA|nr:hypothetical protein M431DRAFT_88169 [Trichoderma harzianum CBS 226.95]KAK0761204.1 hypothetical protein N5P37_006150 [Trichoderma harzianum]PKK47529.1 hypothetical protein CI102_10721 [Trichoderma harzianum]PTB53999.1 hypothetical protein M431DRAFT_88169 [Trichoderma harzianum CBS 226.95]
MAVVDAAPSTPSPPSSIRTPPAPRLGYHDSWEPYSPRKSARISAQRTSARTPSPPPATRPALASPRTAAKSSAQSTAAMASPVASPRKKRQSAADSVRRVTASLAAEASAASGSKDKSVAGRSAAASSLMLPTPSKTPQKPPSSKATAHIQTFARNLFPVAEETELSSPRKRRSKKYSGMTLESFRAEVAEEDIEIFTDSQDRIPKKDESKSNPFVGNAPAAEPSKRRTKRKVHVPGEGSQSVDEASRREDGMIYVFRGKKFFRKFSEFDDEEEFEELDSDVETHFSKPLTRSSIKPRLLFPTKAPAPKTKDMLEEEEAATDVEEAVEAEKPEAKVETVETPAKAKEERAQTPDAPKYAPASPPETRRTTRSTNKLSADSAPIKRTGKKSPFDSWIRTKEHTNRSGTKRAAAEPLPAAPAKRTRS